MKPETEIGKWFEKALRGSERPRHKYLTREPKAGGGYKYVYDTYYSGDYDADVKSSEEWRKLIQQAKERLTNPENVKARFDRALDAAGFSPDLDKMQGSKSKPDGVFLKPGTRIRYQTWLAPDIKGDVVEGVVVSRQEPSPTGFLNPPGLQGSFSGHYQVDVFDPHEGRTRHKIVRDKDILGVVEN